MRLAKFSLVWAVLALSLILQGCMTTSPRKAIRAGNPLPKWEDELVAYYTELDKGGDAEKPPRLKFIVRYEEKFPQLSGIPEAVFKQKERTAFPKLDYGRYAAYRRDKLVAEMEGKKAKLTVAEEELRMQVLEAKLKLMQAEKAVLEATGQEATKEYLDLLKQKMAPVQKQIQDTKTKIIQAEQAVIDFQIDRIEALAAGEDGGPKEGHLEAAGILELAKIERNRIVSDLMLIAKSVHDMKENYLHYTRAGTNVLFDFTQIIASGVGAVAGSESTARALSAVATGSAAAQESVDLRFFYQHATAAVIAIMKKQQHEAEQVVVINMTKDVLEYPLRVALVDYVSFLLAGGLTDALAELGTDAKNKELRELEKLEDLKKMSEEHLKALQDEAAAKAAEKAKQKARRNEYLNLVDQALFGRVSGILGPEEAASADGGTDTE